MRQQDVFKKVGVILNELNEQYEYLKSQGDELNDLELELFAANANFLTDHLEILRKLNAHVTKSLPPHGTPILPPAQPAEQSVPQWQQPEVITSQVNTYQPEPVPDVSAEPVQEPAPVEVVKEPEPVAEEAQPEPVIEIFPEPAAETQQDEPTNEIFFDFTSHKAEEPEHTYVEPVYPHDDEPLHEEDIRSAEEPQTSQETDVRPILEQYQQHDHPSPSINIGGSDTRDDEFSYIRQPEPEIIRHELTVDEADTWEEEQTEQETQPAAPYTEPEAPAYKEPAAPVSEHKPANAHQDAVDYLRARNVSHTAFPPAAEPERPMTLNERISAQLGHNVTESASTAQPIKDLKSAINLNDKMLFVRDLFNGYSLAYSEAIEILNRFNNFDDASRFLANNYVAKNNWESKPDTVEKFYDLLRRRFTPA